MSLFNRAEEIDRKFVESVEAGRFPPAGSSTTLEEAGISSSELVELFESQVASRQLDLAARAFKESGRAFYTIGSSGHEGNVAFGKLLRLTDPAFLHYRSGALMIQRSRLLHGSTPIFDHALAFVASADDPISGGRHKVFGSKPLFVPPQTSTIASHLPKAVGMALAIGRARDLKLADAAAPHDAVVLCSFGDASVNHSTALGAINSALWAAHQNLPVPILFLCEDNGLGISVPTPTGWIESVYSSRPGLRYVVSDGRHVLELLQRGRDALDYVRRTKRPLFLHMRTVRLLGHAGSDAEHGYHSLEAVERAEADDPLLHTARILAERGILLSEEIVRLYRTVGERVLRAMEVASGRPKLTTREEIRSAVTACDRKRVSPPLPSIEDRRAAFGRDFDRLTEPQHMARLLTHALTDLLLRYPGAVVFGEDVGRKGGVYNVTGGMQQRFGVRRVFDTLLDEQSIIGLAMGMAHNGFLPIAEIQFLAYLHNAEDQLRGEAATLPFFSKGQFTNPFLLRIPGLGYQKGFGGHFHNDNSLAVLRDIPGLLIACPSNGADAARMLRACAREAYENGRVSVFVEPIALYMTRDLHAPNDHRWAFPYPPPEEEIAIGEFGVTGQSDRLAIVSYGNGFYLASQAAAVLEREHRIAAKLVDLRWLAPLDVEALARTLEGTERVLIVDECRRTGSLGEALIGHLRERLPNAACRLIAADDCFIPLGVGATVPLPSRDEIARAAVEMTV